MQCNGILSPIPDSALSITACLVHAGPCLVNVWPVPDSILSVSSLSRTAFCQCLLCPGQRFVSVFSVPDSVLSMSSLSGQRFVNVFSVPDCVLLMSSLSQAAHSQSEPYSGQCLVNVCPVLDRTKSIFTQPGHRIINPCHVPDCTRGFGTARSQEQFSYKIKIKYNLRACIVPFSEVVIQGQKSRYIAPLTFYAVPNSKELLDLLNERPTNRSYV